MISSAKCLAVLRLFRWAVLLAALLVGLAYTEWYAPLDVALASAFVAAHEPAVRHDIAEVDLGADESHVWSASVTFLNAILRGTQGHVQVQPPQALVLDVIYSPTSRPDASVQAVAAAIAAVRHLNVRIVLAVDPYKPGSQYVRPNIQAGIVPQIFDAASTAGQSVMEVLRDTSRDAILIYPASIVDKTKTSYRAFPLIVAKDEEDEKDERGKYVPFVIGNPAEMRVYTLAQIERNPDVISESYVVVGSRKSLDAAGVVRGIDSVAWALNDRLMAGSSRYRYVFTSGALVERLTAIAVASSIAIFLTLFYRTRGRTWSVAFATTAAAVLPVLGLLGFYALRAQDGAVFLQPVLPMLSAALASAVCAAASRDVPERAVKPDRKMDPRPLVARPVSIELPRPGGAIAKRELPFFWICDVSGSMAGGSINALNVAVREALPAMRDEAKSFPQARIVMRSIAFSSGAKWLEPQALPLADYLWNDLEATEGESDLGAAIALAMQALDSPPLAPSHFPPVLVLVSDGLATDTSVLEGALGALGRHSVAAKATRVAIALGPDADYVSLQRFGSIPPMRAEDASQLAEIIAIVARTTVGFASSVPADDGMDALEREIARLQNRRALTWEAPVPSEDVW